VQEPDIEPRGLKNGLGYLLETFVRRAGSDSKTALRFVHFIGLALGLGAATLLDLMLLRFFVREPISRQQWKLVHFSAGIVNVGLMLLWASGIGFIVHYALFDPNKLMNEKIWAKLAIVFVLTMNGLFIHSVILPRIRAQLGKTLFDGMSQFQKSVFLVCGGISVTSWYAPVALGAFPQLNFAVPATTILLTYGMLLGIVSVLMHIAVPLIEGTRRTKVVVWEEPGVAPVDSAALVPG
jgi:hypothetical protein